MRDTNRSTLRRQARAAALTTAVLLGVVSTWAAVPTVINYQGRLTDNSIQENPLNGTVTIEFSVWDAATGGSSLWSETQSVQVVAGLFNVLLGSTTPIAPTVFSGGAQRYLEVHVSGETLTPRQRIAATPFANTAAVADDAGSLGGLGAAAYQRRIAAPCPSGYSINAVAADGTATCIQGAAGPQGPPGPAGPGLDSGAISGLLTTCASPSGILVYVPGRSAVAYTAADGTYLLSYLPAGTYDVEIPGYTTVASVAVTSGQTTDLSTDLRNLSTSVSSCGACGAACSTNHITRACADGSCESGVCASGFMDCNANKRADGCEINIYATSNCGGCGVVCSSNHVTNSACPAGVCAGTCAAGFTNCNNNLQSDGCEANISNDTSNCGACGRVCSNNHLPVPICNSGDCFGNCSSGFANCNDDFATDGCETDLTSSNANCGSCGHVCSGATPTCVSGVCS
jgi:hypothetical protein